MEILTNLREIVNTTEATTVKTTGASILMKIWRAFCDFIGVLSSADAETMKEAFVRAFFK